MVKTGKQLCLDYIDKLIKNHKLYDKDELSQIMKNNNHDFNYGLLLDLSDYYDKLEGIYNEPTEPQNNKITKVDLDWQELTDELIKDGSIPNKE